MGRRFEPVWAHNLAIFHLLGGWRRTLSEQVGFTYHFVVFNWNLAHVTLRLTLGYFEGLPPVFLATFYRT